MQTSFVGGKAANQDAYGASNPCTAFTLRLLWPDWTLLHGHWSARRRPMRATLIIRAPSIPRAA